jgi:DNA processing protein
VFALPGSIHSPFSKGCHKLIREGAKLVETAQDILDELRLPLVAPAAGALAHGDGALDPAASAVLAALGHAPADVDTIAARCGLAAAAVIATLTALELDGRAAPIPGGAWQRIL